MRTNTYDVLGSRDSRLYEDTWRSILHSYLDNNLWVIGLIFVVIGVTNSIFSRISLNQTLGQFMALIGGILIIIHYINRFIGSRVA